MAAPQDLDAAAAQTPTPRPVLPGHRLKLANATARQASLVVLGLIVGWLEVWREMWWHRGLLRREEHRSHRPAGFVIGRIWMGDRGRESF